MYLAKYNEDKKHSLLITGTKNVMINLFVSIKDNQIDQGLHEVVGL